MICTSTAQSSQLKFKSDNIASVPTNTITHYSINSTFSWDKSEYNCVSVGILPKEIA